MMKKINAIVRGWILPLALTLIVVALCAFVGRQIGIYVVEHQARQDFMRLCVPHLVSNPKNPVSVGTAVEECTASWTAYQNGWLEPLMEKQK